MKTQRKATVLVIALTIAACTNGADRSSGPSSTSTSASPLSTSRTTAGTSPTSEGVSDEQGTSSTAAAMLFPIETFAGSWVSTDIDGSSMTMEIVRAPTEEYAVVIHDDGALATCAGAAATITGAGRLESDARLIIAQAELTCDDGTTPVFGPPPQADLAGFSLELAAEIDEVVDHLGTVWRRADSEDEVTDQTQTTVPAIDGTLASVPTLGPGMSGGMWPQSTLGEVSAAQGFADAGDPSFTWQLFAQSSADEEPWRAEILTRFIAEGLGWEEYLPLDGLAYAENGGGYFEVKLIRCAPGRANSLASLYAHMPSEIGGCAPTIDEFIYETVMLSLIQPARQGPSGIWVVDQWEMLQPARESSPADFYFFPDMEQVRQFVPPSVDDVDAVLEAFLQSRIDGEGAEQFLLTDPESWPEMEAPLLYATTSGIPYESSTAPRLVKGPVWPTGWREYKVELVAADGTVVEQYFHVIRHGDRLGLFYGFAFNYELQTTEDGKAVAVPQSAFGDTVTFTAPPAQTTGGGSAEMIKLAGDDTDGRVILVYDPNPEFCADHPEIGQNARPANADAVARTILALPDIEVSEPVPVRIAGTDGLQMDLTSRGQSDCLAGGWTHLLPEKYEEWRMSLYLVDNPAFAASPDSARGPAVLAISVTSSPDDFEDVLEQAAPILGSIAFRAG